MFVELYYNITLFLRLLIFFPCVSDMPRYPLPTATEKRLSPYSTTTSEILENIAQFNKMFSPLLDQPGVQNTGTLENRCLNTIMHIGIPSKASCATLTEPLLNRLNVKLNDKLGKIIDCWYTAHTEKSLASTVLANKSPEQKIKMQELTKLILTRQLTDQNINAQKKEINSAKNTPNYLIKLHKVAYDWGLCIHDYSVQRYEENIQNKRLLCKIRLLQWYVQLNGARTIFKYIATFADNHPNQTVNMFPMIPKHYKEYCEYELDTIGRHDVYYPHQNAEYEFVPFVIHDEKYTLCFFKPEGHNSISVQQALPYIFVANAYGIVDSRYISTAYNKFAEILQQDPDPEYKDNANFLPDIDIISDEEFDKDFYPKIMSFDPNFVEANTKYIVAKQTSAALLINSVKFSDRFASPKKTRNSYLNLLQPFSASKISKAITNSKQCVQSFCSIL